MYMICTNSYRINIYYVEMSWLYTAGTVGTPVHPVGTTGMFGTVGYSWYSFSWNIHLVWFLV